MEDKLPKLTLDIPRSFDLIDGDQGVAIFEIRQVATLCLHWILELVLNNQLGNTRIKTKRLGKEASKG